MKKIFVRLRDKHTTWYEPTQQVSIVADRIERVFESAEVSIAINSGILERIPDSDDTKQKYKKQYLELHRQGLVKELPWKTLVKESEDKAEDKDVETPLPENVGTTSAESGDEKEVVNTTPVKRANKK